MYSTANFRLYLEEYKRTTGVDEQRAFDSLALAVNGTRVDVSKLDPAIMSLRGKFSPVKTLQASNENQMIILAYCLSH